MGTVQLTQASSYLLQNKRKEISQDKKFIHLKNDFQIHSKANL